MPMDNIYLNLDISLFKRLLCQVLTYGEAVMLRTMLKWAFLIAMGWIYIYIHINLALFAQNPLQPAASLQGMFFISTYDGFDGSDWHEHLWQTYLGSLFSRVHSTGQVARNLLNESSQCIWIPCHCNEDGLWSYYSVTQNANWFSNTC